MHDLRALRELNKAPNAGKAGQVPSTDGEVEAAEAMVFKLREDHKFLLNTTLNTAQQEQLIDLLTSAYGLD